MSLFIFILIFVQLIFVSLIDIKHKKISNQWIYFNVALTAILWIAYPENYAVTGQKFLYSLTFFFVGFILYLLKIIGAGDSKYLASLYLVIPIQWCEIALYSLFLSTIMIGGFVFFTTVVKKFDQLWVSLLARDFGEVAKLLNNRFSYAPVILVSWMLLGVLVYWKSFLGH
jgi:prepilin peptidase CpaA